MVDPDVEIPKSCKVVFGGSFVLITLNASVAWGQKNDFGGIAVGIYHFKV